MYIIDYNTTRTEMLERIQKLKKDDVKIGLTASTFDLLHAGHIMMLSEAKSECDFLIVALETDPSRDRPEKNAPVQTIFERWVQLAGVSFVDMIIPYESEKDLEDLLLSIKPNIRILGVEYRDKEFTGKQIPDIETMYNKRDHSFSTSDLRKRAKNAEGNK